MTERLLLISAQRAIETSPAWRALMAARIGDGKLTIPLKFASSKGIFSLDSGTSATGAAGATVSSAGTGTSTKVTSGAGGAFLVVLAERFIVNKSFFCLSFWVCTGTNTFWDRLDTHYRSSLFSRFHTQLCHEQEESLKNGRGVPPFLRIPRRFLLLFQRLLLRVSCETRLAWSASFASIHWPGAVFAWASEGAISSG